MPNTYGSLQLSDSITEIGADQDQVLQARYLSVLDDLLMASLTLDTDQLLDRVAGRMGELVRADGCYITLWDEQKQQAYPYSADGQGAETYTLLRAEPGEPTLTASALEAGRPLVIENLKESPYAAPSITALFPSVSALVLPLQIGGNKLGAIIITFHRPYHFRPLEISLYTQISRLISLALSKAHPSSATTRQVNELRVLHDVALAEAEAMREAARRYADELDTLSAVSTALRQAATVEMMLPIILHKSKEALQAILVVVGLLDESGEAVVMRDMLPAGPVFWQRRYRLDEGITGRVAQSRQTYITTNLLEDPINKFNTAEIDCLRQIGSRSLISVPLRTAQKMLGVLNVILGAENEVTQEKVQLIEAIAEIAAGALQRALVLTTLEQRVQERTRELAAANERLQELDRLKSRFVSDVSHELRTPIASLGLYLDLVERGRPEKQEQYWRVMRQQTNRLKFLIEDIFRLSRLDAGREELKFEPVDLNALVTEVMEDHRQQAVEKGLELHFSPAENLPMINGVPVHLKQVVSNLLVNALNYTLAGAVTVRTTLAEDGRALLLQVVDTGPGIAPEDLPHIFERFYRGWNPRAARAPGTGLGLSIVQEITRLHGGGVTVESEPNRGATFTVRLPIS